MDDLHTLKGPDTHNRGPALSEHSEFGDTWKEAVEKINANFAAIAEHLKGGAVAVEHVSGHEAKGLHDRIVVVEQKSSQEFEVLYQRVAELEAQLKAALTSATPPPVVDQAAAQESA
jgi:hypothetical protein